MGCSQRDRAIKALRDREAPLRAEIERLRRRQAQARVWLARCLDMVEGKGPPNWDGIRTFLENDEQTTEGNP